jgi:DNA-directed RNA polymerase specialized sigma24 family protein
MNEPDRGEFRDRSDAELIKLMKSGGRTTPAAKAAFGEFHRRYADDVKRHCLARYRDLLPCHAEVKGFVQGVFIRFWTHALHAFNPERASDARGLATLIRYWLSKQAYWLSLKWRRKVRPVAASKLGIDLDAFSESRGSSAKTYGSVLDALVAREDENRGEISESAQRVQGAFALLTQRQRDAVLRCHPYMDEASGKCRVPRELHAGIWRDLAARGGTPSPTHAADNSGFL